jgi:hypothetical protein
MVVYSHYARVLNFRLSYNEPEVITLKPGANVKTPEQVEVLKKDTVFQALLAQNLVEVVKPAKKKKNPKKVKAEKVEF